MPTRKPKKKVVVQDLTSPANATVVPEGQRRCPICQAVMSTARRHDESIDVCEAHGIWLDRHELERMFLRRMRRTGTRIRRLTAAAQEQGELRGMLWGGILA